MSKIFQPNINEKLVSQYLKTLKEKIHIFQDGRYSSEDFIFNNQTIQLGKTELNLLLYRKPAQFIATNTFTKDARTMQVLCYVAIEENSLKKVSPALLPEIISAITELNNYLPIAHQFGFRDNSIVYQTNASREHLAWKEEDVRNSSGYRK